MTGEYVPVEAVLPFRSRFGEPICELGLGSDDTGETERLPGGDVEGHDSIKDIGVVGPSA